MTWTNSNMLNPNISYTNQERNAEGANKENKKKEKEPTKK